MSQETDDLRERLEVVEEELESLKASAQPRRVGVRKRSEAELFGWPLFELAMGPDPENDEVRGHARAIIAIGDIATGFFALGGIARGVIAIGGLAVGLLSVGGCALGFLMAFGGGAVGLIAIGGVAMGGVVFGGAAMGYYAWGGAAIGVHTVSDLQQDPQAIQFFRQWVPQQLLPPLPPLRH